MAVSPRSTTEAYSRAAFRALGLEGQVKFVGIGGGAPKMAALRSGAVDMLTHGPTGLALTPLGQLRVVVNLNDYLPSPWAGLVTFSTTKLVKARPQVLRKAIRVILLATHFMELSPQWTIKEMESYSRYPREGAKLVHKLMVFSRDGKIRPQALKNVRDFLVSYGFIPKERRPPLEKLYTKGFVQ